MRVCDYNKEERRYLTVNVVNSVNKIIRTAHTPPRPNIVENVSCWFIYLLCDGLLTESSSTSLAECGIAVCNGKQ